MPDSNTPVIMVQKARPGRAVSARGLKAHQSALEKDTIIDIPLHALTPGKYQPRSRLSEEALKGLAQTIKSVGVIQPIVIKPSPVENTSYEIVAGERRWRACLLLNVETIPCIIRDGEDRGSYLSALIENIQREDLHFIDLARSYREIKTREDLSDKELGDLIGRSRSSIINTLGVLQLEASSMNIIAVSENITLGHVKPVYGLAADDQQKLLEGCEKNKWSVRKMELAAKEAKTKNILPEKKDMDSLVLDLEETLVSAGFSESIKVSKKGKSYQLLVSGSDGVRKLIGLLKGK